MRCIASFQPTLNHFSHPRLENDKHSITFAELDAQKLIKACGFCEFFGSKSPNINILTIGVQNRDLGASIAVPGTEFRRTTFLSKIEKVIFWSGRAGRPARPGQTLKKRLENHESQRKWTGMLVYGLIF